MLFRRKFSEVRKRFLIDFEMDAVIRAADFAAVKHQRQRRKDRAETPYINHPIGVARILSDLGGVVDDPVVLQAALLHDTVEDTETTPEEIEAEFGRDVRCVVDEVTDDKSLPSKERKRLQIEHAPNATPRAKLVKLADKLYNLRDLERENPVGWSEERREQYFAWSAQVCSGLVGVNTAIEAEVEKLLRKHGVSMYSKKA